MACASLLSDDDLRRFRTKPCRRNRQSGGVCEFGPDRCQYSHNDQWPRRCPFYLSNQSSIRYIPKICPDVVLGGNSDPERRTIGTVVSNKCSRGGSCPYAHSLEEVLYHPLVYKTQRCPQFATGECTTYYCPFVHGTAETRDVQSVRFTLPFTNGLVDSTIFPNVEITAKLPTLKPARRGTLDDSWRPFSQQQGRQQHTIFQPQQQQAYGEGCVVPLLSTVRTNSPSGTMATPTCRTGTNSTPPLGWLPDDASENEPASMTSAPLLHQQKCLSTHRYSVPWGGMSSPDVKLPLSEGTTTTTTTTTSSHATLSHDVHHITTPSPSWGDFSQHGIGQDNNYDALQTVQTGSRALPQQHYDTRRAAMTPTVSPSSSSTLSGRLTTSTVTVESHAGCCLGSGTDTANTDSIFFRSQPPPKSHRTSEDAVCSSFDMTPPEWTPFLSAFPRDDVHSTLEKNDSYEKGCLHHADACTDTSTELFIPRTNILWDTFNMSEAEGGRCTLLDEAAQRTPWPMPPPTTMGTTGLGSGTAGCFEDTDTMIEFRCSSPLKSSMESRGWRTGDATKRDLLIGHKQHIQLLRERVEQLLHKVQAPPKVQEYWQFDGIIEEVKQIHELLIAPSVSTGAELY